VEELATLDDDGPGLLLGGAEPAASGAGLLDIQMLGLLLRGLFKVAGGQPSSGGNSNLFHGIKIDVQAGPLLAENAADDDFAPLLGQSVDLSQVLVVELARRHMASVV
jgi:hypothetical protein